MCWRYMRLSVTALFVAWNALVVKADSLDRSHENVATHNPFLPHGSAPDHQQNGLTSKMEIPIQEYLNVEPSNNQDEFLPFLKGSQGLDEHTQIGDFFSKSTIRQAFARTSPSILSSVQDHGDENDSPRETSMTQINKQSLRKTGTTIAGIVGLDYCILAADTRATMGMTVADTRAEKLHPLTENCWAAGAGTSADLQHMARSCHHTFRLLQLQQEYTIGNPHRRHLSPRGWRERTSGTANKDIQQLLSTPKFPSMTSICHWLREELYNQGGACQANLIVGGICPKSKAPFLRAIHPHGSMDEVAFAALGSGGLAAMAVLESSLANAHWKRETQSQNSTASSDTTLPLQDAISILLRAVRAGIENDLGSGSQIDLVIMHKNGTTTYQRAAVPEAELPPIVSENDDASAESTTSSLTLPETNDGLGVNGFGNTPFVLRPSLLGQRSIPKRQEEVEREWNDLLGLNC